MSDQTQAAGGHSSEPHHPQVWIEHDGERAEVDEQLAPLLLDCWRLDCWTINSCQDNFGKVWIDFGSGGAAEAFLSIVAGAYDEETESLYNRIVQGWEPDDWAAFRNDRAWQYDVHPDDFSVETEYDSSGDLERVTPLGPPEVRFSLSVRFPPADLPEVERRIRAHLLERDRTVPTPVPTPDIENP